MNTLQIVCLALLGVLVFALGANVTRYRSIRGASGGDQQPTDPADRLFIAVRAHANAAEYVPSLAFLILVCATLSDGWWVDALAVTAVAVRYLHALGMLTAKTMDGFLVMRFVGAIGTYFAGITLAVTAVVLAV
jgi:uncharacterized membrane protein YecN with MAPEG domain